MKVIVIGAGATGLAAGYLLSRGGAEVTILEAGERPGGLLATFEVAENARLEYFYHHFFTHDAEIGWLLGELGLQDRVMFPAPSMGMYRNGRLYPFSGLLDLLRFDAIGIGGRLRFGLVSAMLAYSRRLSECEDVAALEWFERWAGRQATNAIWRPLLRIKFGDVADRISLAWMAGRMRQRARSRKKGEERLGYMEGSFQVLVDAWVEDLTRRGVSMRLKSPVQRLIVENGLVAGVVTGECELRADAVVSTVPTLVLSKLVRPTLPDYADALDRIQYMNALCTVLTLKESLSSVYWTNIADPGYSFGGVIEHTNIVPPEAYDNNHIIYLSRYLTNSDPLWIMPDGELLQLQIDELSRIYKRDVRALVKRSWVFRGHHAAAITGVNFHKSIPQFRSPLPGLFVASMCHVHPDDRSMNNSIRIAAEVVRTMGMTQVADSVSRGLSHAAKYGGDPAQPR